MVTRGKFHNFVGIDIAFKDNGTVEVIIKEYINEFFEAYGDPVNKLANTPANHNLFVS